MGPRIVTWFTKLASFPCFSLSLMFRLGAVKLWEKFEIGSFRPLIFGVLDISRGLGVIFYLLVFGEISNFKLFFLLLCCGPIFLVNQGGDHIFRSSVIYWDP